MKNSSVILWVVAIVIILGGGWYFLNHKSPAQQETTTTDNSAATTTNSTATSTSWNYENGAQQPNLALSAVQTSIIGKWQSTDDAKFVREFDRGGIAKDSYDGKVESTGTWATFNSTKPLEVSFRLEPDVVYLQMTMEGSQAPTLNFKIIKLTPDELTMIYLDHGNVLDFKRVQ